MMLFFSWVGALKDHPDKDSNKTAGVENGVPSRKNWIEATYMMF